MEKAQKNLALITRYFSDFTPVQLEQFAALGDLYPEWNGKINVISRKDIDSLYEKHVLHSLSIAAAFDFPAGASIVDLGTGGGFPGIPLAIYFPEVQFHLADSIGKKIKVAAAIASALGLTNITTQHTRIEDIRNRRFNFVVSRAVAPLKDLWKWSKPLLHKKDGAKQGGLICLKGGDIAQEIAESGCRPRVEDIYELFPEESFKDKYVVFVPV